MAFIRTKCSCRPQAGSKSPSIRPRKGLTSRGPLSCKGKGPVWYFVQVARASDTPQRATRFAGAFSYFLRKLPSQRPAQDALCSFSSVRLNFFHGLSALTLGEHMCPLGAFARNYIARIYLISMNKLSVVIHTPPLRQSSHYCQIPIIMLPETIIHDTNNSHHSARLL